MKQPLSFFSSKTFISIGVSGLVLAAIYWRIDVAAMLQVLVGIDLPIFVGAIAFFVPTTLIAAWRLQVLIPDDAKQSLGECTKLILAASTLNMVLPSKMGDIAKAAFLHKHGKALASVSISVVVFEKGVDLLALLVWCAIGLLIYPHEGPWLALAAATVIFGLAFGLLAVSSDKFADLWFDLAVKVLPSVLQKKLGHLRTSWHEVRRFVWQSRERAAGIVVVSLSMWLLNLIQIWLLILALGAPVRFIDNLALTPLAILAGLVPLTFAGVGTRDAALIVLYQPFMAPSMAAALGILCTLRYMLPAVVGLPFLSRYLETMQSENTERRVTQSR